MQELQDITRTSLGPNGMNKLIINHLDKIFVTSDCATIIKEMEIQHPAAKSETHRCYAWCAHSLFQLSVFAVVVMAAHMQETEIGDGSNFVVCLAGELLHQAGKPRAHILASLWPDLLAMVLRVAGSHGPAPLGNHRGLQH